MSTATKNKILVEYVYWTKLTKLHVDLISNISSLSCSRRQVSEVRFKIHDKKHVLSVTLKTTFFLYLAAREKKESITVSLKLSPLICDKFKI